MVIVILFLFANFIQLILKIIFGFASEYRSRWLECRWWIPTGWLREVSITCSLKVYHKSNYLSSQGDRLLGYFMIYLFVLHSSTIVSRLLFHPKCIGRLLLICGRWLVGISDIDHAGRLSLSQFCSVLSAELTTLQNTVRLAQLVPLPRTVQYHSAIFCCWTVYSFLFFEIIITGKMT